MDRDEDQPTVVVLKPGDLTAEEADKILKGKITVGFAIYFFLRCIKVFISDYMGFGLLMIF